MWVAGGWKDYRVLDASSGEKLERWGKYILRRPDPQIIWNTPKDAALWGSANARFHTKQKGGEWEVFNLPEQWSISYKNLKFKIKPFSFKHTGLFPEQAANWDWMSEKIKVAARPVKALNLFAYTGGATLALLKAGAHVTHVDASKGMVALAKENAAASNLADRPVRWIVDDCIKFVEREIRRGNRYDAIVMDPPTYGRGPRGEMWRMEDSIYDFLMLCGRLLSDKPLFFLLNAYTSSLAPSVLTYLLKSTIGAKRGVARVDEIGLPVESSGLILPCGSCGRWSA